jgi:hypothetical protein
MTEKKLNLPPNTFPLSEKDFKVGDIVYSQSSNKVFILEHNNDPRYPLRGGNFSYTTKGQWTPYDDFSYIRHLTPLELALL